MDKKEEERLLRLFQEVSDNSDVSNESNDGWENRDSDISDESSSSVSSVGTDNDCEYRSDDSHESNNLATNRLQNVQISDSDRETSSDEEEWKDITKDVPDYGFDNSSSGVKLQFDHLPTPYEVFNSLWTDEIINNFVNQTNAYGSKLSVTKRPKAKNSRSSSMKSTDAVELKKFMGLCLLQGQIRFPILRRLFSYDPLYYHPVFSSIMSGRRFEQLLRSFNCHNRIQSVDRLNKISDLLKELIKNYQNAYSPDEALSLDESLLLHRGRLSFRQFIKGKKAKYGIKFFELCCPNGYNHNIEIYKGKQEQTDESTSKLQSLVLRLMKPFLDKGHHLVMDNYYNSVPLSKALLQRKTHTTGTLRSNRRGNPKVVVTAKLKKGEHIWRRSGMVYVSKWRDKREVLCITTKYQPTMISVTNSHGKVEKKPIEIARYNDYMSGVDRADQLTSYYSCPRKSIRWYKKVLFHLLDVTVINSYLIHREIHTKVNAKYLPLLTFREILIKEMLGIPLDLTDGRKLVRKGFLHNNRRFSSSVADNVPLIHVPEKIPVPDNYKRKSYFLRCRQCSKNQRRGQTSWRCRGCTEKPPLCQGTCFEEFHRKEN